METQRLQNRQAVHDRMLAVARAKESIRQDMQVDMEKVKSKMKEVSELIRFLSKKVWKDGTRISLIKCGLGIILRTWKDLVLLLFSQ